MAILNVIRWRTGSQWSFFKAGVMWALRFRPRTSGAIVDAGRLTSTDLLLRVTQPLSVQPLISL